MNTIYNLINEILFSNDISVVLITIIAGLFGFIIAAIPLTIQFLEIKDNKVIDGINSNYGMKKKIFNSYINTIQASFLLFVFILIIQFIKIIGELPTILLYCAFLVYIALIIYFLKQLYKLIKILKELILTYLNM